MREFAKVGTGFWTSTEMQRLSDDGKLLALYLVTSPHSNAAGVFRLPDGYVIGDLGWPLERVSKAFAELSENGFATRCSATLWVVIHKHFKHNHIENPNQAKHVLKLLEQVPRDSEVILLIEKAIVDNRDQITVPWAKQFLEAIGNPSETVLEQREGEREVEREGEVGVPPCPHQQLVDLYHETLPDHPRCMVLNEKRKGTIRARWVEWMRRGKYSDRASGLDWWRRYFEHAGKSRFLSGQAPGTNDRPPFIADIDFLFSLTGNTKIVEGFYHRDAA